MPQPVRTLTHARTKAPDTTQRLRFVTIADYEEEGLNVVIYFDVATGHIWTDEIVMHEDIWTVSLEAYTVDGAGGLVNGRFQ